MEDILMADLGGTNIRFAVLCKGKISRFESYKCAEFDGLSDALSFYRHQTGPLPKKFALCVAAPVFGNSIKMTNNHWSFSTGQLKRKFSFTDVSVLNDFKAAALSLPYLDKKDFIKIGGGKSLKSAPKIILGAGTGLGVGILIENEDGKHQALASEGGHILLPVQSKNDFDLYSKMMKKYGRVSAEKLISGRGLMDIYSILSDKDLPACQIVERAVDGDKKAQQAILQMFSFLGVVAGNLALSVGALGGVYISGGIITQPNVLDFFKKSDFRQQFESIDWEKGYLSRIPTYVIHRPNTVFKGLYHIFDKK